MAARYGIFLSPFALLLLGWRIGKFYAKFREEIPIQSNIELLGLDRKQIYIYNSSLILPLCVFLVGTWQKQLQNLVFKLTK